MADQYQSPEATATPSIETPVPIASGSGVQNVRSKREPQRTWERQLALDFVTVRQKVIKHIKEKAEGEKWSIKNAEEQRVFIEVEIEKELKRRERQTNTTTARWDYPEIWEKECENVVEGWIRQLSNIPIISPHGAKSSCARYDSDRDDEERDLPRGIKREFQDGEDEPSNKHMSCKRTYKPNYREASVDDSSDDQSDNSESEDGGEETVNAGAGALSKKTCRGKAKNAAKSVACGRGFGLIMGSSGSEGVNVRVSKPEWVWKNGHLFVWPAIAGMSTEQ